MNPDVREVLEQAEGKSLVERLANRWASRIVRHDRGFMTEQDDARWWLNAIAEELDNLPSMGGGIEWPGLWCADWLREQASK